MNVADASSYYFNKAARVLDVSSRMAALLTRPMREVKVQVPVEGEDGEVDCFDGWLIQHDNTRGPMKGGLRFHPGVDRELMLGLASLMTWKTAVMNLPFGGSMGGVACEAGAVSPRVLERLTRKYVDQIQELIGPARDILGPDVNTNPQVMAWVMDQYSKYHGHAPAVVTGKPIELYGSRGRDSATGRGLLCVCRDLLADIGMGVKGTRIAVQGFGNVGSHATRLLCEEGARIVAVSDLRGAVFNPDGLDVPALFEHVRVTGSLAGFAGGRTGEQDELLAIDCDVLVAAALEGAITAQVARGIRAKLIIEGANAPTEPEADELLEQRGIIVAPDILANAGGVVVSYFEWVQNIQQFTWEEERVNAELEKTMREAYERVAQLAKTRRISLRTAAYVLAVSRVGKSTALRGG